MIRGTLCAALALLSLGWTGCARDSEAYRVFWKANDYYGRGLINPQYTPKEVTEPDGARYSGEVEAEVSEGDDLLMDEGVLYK